MDPKEKTTTTTGEEAEGQENVIQEDNLLKSIQDIEQKAKGEEPAVEEPETDPKVETATVEKSLTETVEAEGSEDLKKALEISPILKEFADIVGLHVDTALKALEKSLNSAAERDLASVGALTALAGQIETLSKSISEYGDKPAIPAGAKKPVTTKEEVLGKSVTSEEDRTEDASQLTQPQIYAALESLVKSADEKGDRAEADRLTRSFIKYDSTKQLDQHELQAVANEHTRMAAR